MVVTRQSTTSGATFQRSLFNQLSRKAWSYQPELGGPVQGKVILEQAVILLSTRTLQVPETVQERATRQHGSAAACARCLQNLQSARHLPQRYRTLAVSIKFLGLVYALWESTLIRLEMFSVSGVRGPKVCVKLWALLQLQIIAWPDGLASCVF